MQFGNECNKVIKIITFFSIVNAICPLPPTLKRTFTAQEFYLIRVHYDKTN